jgi:hypothetical protein
MIDTLLSWGGKQEERRLALASKLKWESHDSCGLDVSRLTDRQAEERLAYDRCGFIFAMYHANTCVLLRCSASRTARGGPVHSPSRGWSIQAQKLYSPVAQQIRRANGRFELFSCQLTPRTFELGVSCQLKSYGMYNVGKFEHLRQSPKILPLLKCN